MICSCSINFCCAHRIFGHEGKCANLHGHNYALEVSVKASSLDELGRIIDFSILKKTLKDWVDEHWDHNVLIYEKDQKILKIKDELVETGRAFVCPFNPTAENMALYLFHEICPQIFLKHGVKVVKVELAETNNNKVVVETGNY